MLWIRNKEDDDDDAPMTINYDSNNDEDKIDNVDNTMTTTICTLVHTMARRVSLLKEDDNEKKYNDKDDNDNYYVWQ